MSLLKKLYMHFIWRQVDEYWERPFVEQFYTKKGLNISSTSPQAKIRTIQKEINANHPPTYKTPEEGLQKYERLLIVHHKIKNDEVIGINTSKYLLRKSKSPHPKPN